MLVSTGHRENVIARVAALVVLNRLGRPAALLLVSYLLWACFATALNFVFWFLKR